LEKEIDIISKSGIMQNVQNTMKKRYINIELFDECFMNISPLYFFLTFSS
jgi:hypothetical protein